MTPTSIILRVGGTNCDKETVVALKSVGFKTLLVHINQLLKKEVKLQEFDLLVIPGGFSFGDYISAGKVFAVEIYYKLRKELEKFVLDKNKYILGICNGFQVLVKLGLLPKISFVQQVTLTENDSGRFECRWVYLKVNKNNPSVLSKLPDIIELPIAHAEGKFVAKEKVLQEIVENNCIIFQYCDKNGVVSSNYPLNPNGSMLNIAGITDTSGRIIGLMPHPERFIIKNQYPVYENVKNPYGKQFFELIKKKIQKIY